MLRPSQVAMLEAIRLDGLLGVSAIMRAGGMDAAGWFDMVTRGLVRESHVPGLYRVTVQGEAALAEAGAA